jgi:hypothetical protein
MRIPIRHRRAPHAVAATIALAAAPIGLAHEVADGDGTWIRPTGTEGILSECGFELISAKKIETAPAKFEVHVVQLLVDGVPIAIVRTVTYRTNGDPLDVDCHAVEVTRPDAVALQVQGQDVLVFSKVVFPAELQSVMDKQAKPPGWKPSWRDILYGPVKPSNARPLFRAMEAGIPIVVEYRGPGDSKSTTIRADHLKRFGDWSHLDACRTYLDSRVAMEGGFPWSPRTKRRQHRH